MQSLRPDSPLQYLKNVGPSRAEVLADMGLRTASDLLWHFPRDLAHMPGREPIEKCRARLEQIVTVGGVLERIRWRGRPHRAVFTARIADNTGALDVVFFNGNWLRDKVAEGDRVVMTGKLRRSAHGAQLTNPKFQVLTDDDQPAPGAQWEPVYPATADITSGHIRAIVEKNLGPLLGIVEDFIPEQIVESHELIDRRLAVGWMHFPSLDAASIAGHPHNAALAEGLDGEEILRRLHMARRRLAFDEAFLFQLALGLRRRARQRDLAATALPCDDRVRERILARFPFELTAAQAKAVGQIAEDMARPVPMNRLLQGDVGSGKTVVALFASLLAVAHGRQAAIMAPTEILATQHHERISAYLESSRVRWALLTGSLTAARRREVHAQLAAGELDLVVGTTALLSEGVEIPNLAVAVIDEQHKFGVHQRLGLRLKSKKGTGTAQKRYPSPFLTGTAPHVLVMTATPIPRSLALTVFGDLAVSVIDELPPGRGEIKTRVATPPKHVAAMDFLEEQLAAGGQAFVVCPRVADSEDDDNPDAPDDDREPVASAERTFEELRPRFGKFGLELAHGQMDRERQEQAIARFAAGESRVLVATTVIEVGIDVPAANVMLVLGAERFGLAQLHQLRGRIGRSADGGKSFCLLLTDATEGDALDRLRVMEKTRDGFRIAEEDLARRGPGQFFGTAQHGLPEFRVLNLARDLRLIRDARQSAFNLVAGDPKLTDPEHAELRKQLEAKHGETIALIETG